MKRKIHTKFSVNFSPLLSARAHISSHYRYDCSISFNKYLTLLNSMQIIFIRYAWGTFFQPDFTLQCQQMFHVRKIESILTAY
jgi:hypothetical protein